ncbi:MFS transporter [Nocardia sp. NPDC004722]
MTETLETSSLADKVVEGARQRPLAAILTAIGIPTFMVTLDNLVVTNALPVIRTELHASLSDLQWFVNAYTLAFASLLLTAAALGDRLGRRRLYLAGIALFTLGSAACALATEPWMLIAARAAQGFGGAAVMPLSLTLLSAAVPEKMRSAAIGIWGGISGLGVALGPVVGGAVVEGINWQWIFWINVPIGIFAVPFAARVLNESFGGARGLILAARIGQGDVSAGNSQLLEAVAVALVGTSVLGRGKPNVWGTALGAVLIGIISSGLTIAGLPYYTQDVVQGGVLVLALIFSFTLSGGKRA